MSNSKVEQTMMTKNLRVQQQREKHLQKNDDPDLLST